MVAQAIKNHIEGIEYREKKIFWILFSVFAILLISYGFLINKTIMNAVSEQQLQKQMSTLNSNVNSVEFAYLNAENSITMDFALSKGFVAIPENNFAMVSPDAQALSLSLNEN